MTEANLQPRKVKLKLAERPPVNLGNDTTMVSSPNGGVGSEAAKPAPQTTNTTTYLRGRGHTKKKKRNPPPPAHPDAMRAAMQAAIGGSGTKYHWVNDARSQPQSSSQQTQQAQSTPAFTKAIYIPNEDRRRASRAATMDSQPTPMKSDITSSEQQPKLQAQHKVSAPKPSKKKRIAPKRAKPDAGETPIMWAPYGVAFPPENPVPAFDRSFKPRRWTRDKLVLPTLTGHFLEIPVWRPVSLSQSQTSVDGAPPAST